MERNDRHEIYIEIGIVHLKMQLKNDVSMWDSFGSVLLRLVELPSHRAMWYY